MWSRSVAEVSEISVGKVISGSCECDVPAASQIARERTIKSAVLHIFQFHFELVIEGGGYGTSDILCICIHLLLMKKNL